MGSGTDIKRQFIGLASTAVVFGIAVLQYRALPACPDRSQRRVPTEVRKVLATLQQRLQEIRVLIADLNLLAVNINDWHRSPLYSSSPVAVRDPIVSSPVRATPLVDVLLEFIPKELQRTR